MTCKKSKTCLLGDDFSGVEPEAVPPRDEFSDMGSVATPPVVDKNCEPPHVTLDQQVQGQSGSSTEAALPQPAARRPRLEEATASSPTKRTSETSSVTFVKTTNRFSCV